MPKAHHLGRHQSHKVGKLVVSVALLVGPSLIDSNVI